MFTDYLTTGSLDTNQNSYGCPFGVLLDSLVRLLLWIKISILPVGKKVILLTFVSNGSLGRYNGKVISPLLLNIKENSQVKSGTTK